MNYYSKVNNTNCIFFLRKLDDTNLNIFSHDKKELQVRLIIMLESSGIVDTRIISKRLVQIFYIHKNYYT